MLLKSIKSKIPFDKVKGLFDCSIEKGNKAITHKWFLVLLSFLCILFLAFFAIDPKPLAPMCIYILFLIGLFVSAQIIKNKESMYQWKMNLWVAGFLFLCKLVFVCYFKQWASENITYMLVLQSVLVFCFLVLLKMIGVIIAVVTYEQKSNEKIKGYVNKTIFIITLFSLAGVLMYRHTNDFSGVNMSGASLAFNLAFSMLYYQWIVDIPFYLIYKEEIDADLGL